MGQLTKNSGNTDFEPIPEDDHQLVVCDVIDLGWIEKTFDGFSQGLKPHIQIVYQSAAVRDDGKPYLVFGKRQVLSTHERSGLYKEICGIVGKKQFDAILDEGPFDTEDLIGMNVDASIIHNTGKNGQVYANIDSMRPWKQARGPEIVPRDYVRRGDRPDKEQPEHSAFGPSPEATAKSRAAPAAKATVDPRSSNDSHKETRKQVIQSILADAEDDDDGADIFDDQDGMTAEQVATTKRPVPAQGALLEEPVGSGSPSYPAN